MTYSILAYDPATGSIGSAVASCSVAVGGTVTYSRFGVGMVNTQHLSHLTIGQRVLDEMERGVSPQEALDLVLPSDAEASERQLIAADVHAEQGAWTGGACTEACRHVVSKSCVAAGNTLAAESVIDRMVEVFEASAEGTLGERLMRSLEAGEAAGGDKRGRQAAAVRVIPPPSMPTAINLDLRVDDHPEPLRELRRLYQRFREEFGR